MKAGTREAQAAEELQRRNIIQGRPDGRFDGTAPVNRAELSKFLLLSQNISPRNLRNQGTFSDVPQGAWYEKYVMEAADRGILSGYPDGRFLPAQTVNTAEFLKMFVKTFSLEEDLPHEFWDVPEGAWFASYAGVVPRYQLFPRRNSRSLEPARDMTRNEVAVAIYQYLTAQEVLGNEPPDPIENPENEVVPNSSTCKDFDAGKDYFRAAKTFTQEENFFVQDVCVTLLGEQTGSFAYLVQKGEQFYGRTPEGVCREDDCYLMEAFCSSKGMDKEVVLCKFGCEFGACLEENQQSALRPISSPPLLFSIERPTPEERQAIEAERAQFIAEMEANGCSDPDKGKAVYMRTGIYGDIPLSGISSDFFSDYCLEEEGMPPGSGKKLVEWYCEDGEVKMFLFSCDCENGACRDE
ncbi:MAG: S-layer homology domain-containing protein [Candidatus Gracilibacteria bacterium]|nr:S-layer homology domain-containing protein [Candidatus Gracilibacteria bacterium]